MCSRGAMRASASRRGRRRWTQLSRAAPWQVQRRRGVRRKEQHPDAICDRDRRWLEQAIAQSFHHDHPDEVYGQIVADGCTFKPGGPPAHGTARITNSVIMTRAGELALSITSDSRRSDIVGIRSSVETLTATSATLAAATSPATSSSITEPFSRRRTAGSTTTSCSRTSAFHLMPGSPAVDAADLFDASIGRDYDGVPRPQGAFFDVGAFELPASAALRRTEFDRPRRRSGSRDRP